MKGNAENSWDEDSDEENDNAEVTHSLPFKCIGAAHERERQEFLERAHTALRRERNVRTRLRTEPTNEKDSDAIAIDMSLDNVEWVHVGYIARELTRYIHPLFDSGGLLDVYVQHIIFRVSFLKVGFYPKIIILRKGAWDNYVVRKSASVR